MYSSYDTDWLFATLTSLVRFLLTVEPILWATSSPATETSLPGFTSSGFGSGCSVISCSWRTIPHLVWRLSTFPTTRTSVRLSIEVAIAVRSVDARQPITVRLRAIVRTGFGIQFSNSANFFTSLEGFHGIGSPRDFLNTFRFGTFVLWGLTVSSIFPWPVFFLLRILQGGIVRTLPWNFPGCSSSRSCELC